MNDLVDIAELKQEIDDTGESFENGDNFESIYSRLDSGSEPKHERAKRNIEKKIEEYFSALHLPDHATIYDHMLLSLQQGDAVFTFNWDPFLFDAYERNRGTVPLLYPVEKKGYSKDPYIRQSWEAAEQLFEKTHW